MIVASIGSQFRSALSRSGLHGSVHTVRLLLIAASIEYGYLSISGRNRNRGRGHAGTA